MSLILGQTSHFSFRDVANHGHAIELAAHVDRLHVCNQSQVTTVSITHVSDTYRSIGMMNVW